VKIKIWSLFSFIGIFMTFGMVNAFGITDEFRNHYALSNDWCCDPPIDFDRYQLPSQMDRIERETYHVVKISHEDAKLRLVNIHDLNKTFNFNTTSSVIPVTQEPSVNDEYVERINFCKQDIQKINKISIQELRTQINTITENELRDKIEK